MGAAGPALLVAQAGLTAIDTYQQYNADKMQGRYAQTSGDINARFLRMQADDALTRGDLAAGASRRESAGVLGAQKASYAGQGVDVGSGSSAAVAGEDTALAENKANDIKTNAWRAAWGFQQEANAAQNEGRTKKLAYDNEAYNSILTGGMRIASTFAQPSAQSTGGGRFATVGMGGKARRIPVAPDNYYQGSQ